MVQSSTQPSIHSPAESLASLPEQERARILRGLTDAQANGILYSWKFWARPKQRAPDGDWGVWVIRAGRGFGKTLSGSSWVHERAMASPRWIALVARTPADARDYMVEGPSGLVHRRSPAPSLPPDEAPYYEPSKRRLTWPNGSWATIYSDEEPDQLRGFSGDTAWLDEFAKFKYPRECWENLQFGMREASNDRPRRLITTTPRPLDILKEIQNYPSTRVIHGSSYENRSNLDPTWFNETIVAYEGTRLGRQEIHGEILDDIPGALWTRAMLERCRAPKPARFKRVVVSVDPSGTTGDDTANDIGIVVAGLGVDDIGYILADMTCSLPPAGWGQRAVQAYKEFEADRIVAERNFGGAMVDHVLRTVDKNVPIRMVTASRGKVARAEPVSALYEQKRVKHVTPFPELEDQLCNFTSTGYQGNSSPDRADALVWAITDLMLNKGVTFTNVAIGGKVFSGGLSLK